MRFKIVSIALVIIGPMLVITGIIEGMKVSKIEKEGVETTAIILSGQEKRGRKGGKTYKLELSVPKATKDHTVSIPKEIYEKSAVGAPIAIKQLPNEPDKFIVVGDDDESLMMELAGSAMLLIGGIMVWWNFFRKSPNT
jgi:hypothetical protein